MLSRLSPSMAVSLLALIIALGGGGFAATGGNFILGVLNDAASSTRLVGNTASAALRVSNPSMAAGATALALAVADDTQAPLTVNSTKRVVNLNADLLDNLHANEMARVGRAQITNFFSIASLTTQTSIEMEIPAPGFVLLVGSAIADTDNAACNPCYAHLRFQDLDQPTLADRLSPAVIASIGNGTATEHDATLTSTWVFAVMPGTRTFSLQTGKFPGVADITFFNPVLTALFIPFGPDGTKALTAEAAPQRAAPKTLGPVERNGMRRVLN